MHPVSQAGAWRIIMSKALSALKFPINPLRAQGRSRARKPISLWTRNHLRYFDFQNEPISLGIAVSLALASETAMSMGNWQLLARHVWDIKRPQDAVFVTDTVMIRKSLAGQLSPKWDGRCFGVSAIQGISDKDPLKPALSARELVS